MKYSTYQAIKAFVLLEIVAFAASICVATAIETESFLGRIVVFFMFLTVVNVYLCYAWYSKRRDICHVPDYVHMWKTHRYTANEYGHIFVKLAFGWIQTEWSIGDDDDTGWENFRAEKEKYKKRFDREIII